MNQNIQVYCYNLTEENKAQQTQPFTFSYIKNKGNDNKNQKENKDELKEKINKLLRPKLIANNLNSRLLPSFLDQEKYNNSIKLELLQKEKLIVEVPNLVQFISSFIGEETMSEMEKEFLLKEITERIKENRFYLKLILDEFLDDIKNPISHLFELKENRKLNEIIEVQLNSRMVAFNLKQIENEDYLPQFLKQAPMNEFSVIIV
ncbi:hypothetical protein K502DRAFT_332659 [Neoconidiobolus thromboides FSU 785]|nr:hypothetical protein K502DRAFT_332659 [Neoconidiobolus thromboides FSU 785]